MPTSFTLLAALAAGVAPAGWHDGASMAKWVKAAAAAAGVLTGLSAICAYKGMAEAGRNAVCATAEVP